MNPISNRSVRLALLFGVLFASAATASPSLVLSGDGTLLGANDLLVDGHLYDVAFEEGTCADVFGTCDETHFAFKSESAALDASKALLDQVFLDVPGKGNFDSVPSLTNGCSFLNNCWALTPYAILDVHFLIAQTLNNTPSDGPDGYFVFQPNGPGVPISDYDSRDDINGVFAKWTRAQVPEPTTVVLTGAGLVVAALKRRSRSSNS